MVKKKNISEEMKEENIKQENRDETKSEKEKDIKQNAAEKKEPDTEKKPRSKKTKKAIVEEYGQKLAEINDKYLRLYSEFDNYRKRTLKEKIELTKTASSEIITSLLPVLDDCDRAKKSIHESKDLEAVKQGMELIIDKFKNILIQKGLEAMESIGEEFNTDKHEAITNIPAPTEDQKGKVIDETEKGYILKGKVIRYAKVIVGS